VKEEMEPEVDPEEESEEDKSGLMVKIQKLLDLIEDLDEKISKLED